MYVNRKLLVDSQSRWQMQVTGVWRGLKGNRSIVRKTIFHHLPVGTEVDVGERTYGQHLSRFELVPKYFIWHCFHRCWDSSVGIATHYGLDGPGIESWWRARFSAPVQGPTQPPIQWVGGLSPGVKQLGHGVDHPPHLAPRLKEEQSYTSAPPLGLRGLFQGELYLYLYGTVFTVASDGAPFPGLILLLSSQPLFISAVILTTLACSVFSVIFVTKNMRFLWFLCSDRRCGCVTPSTPR